MKQLLKKFIYIVPLLLLVVVSRVSAAPLVDKTVGSEATENDDVVLFGEDLLLEEGGVINGDVTLFGGNATLGGTTNGDVVLFGGNLLLAESAVITGDCITMGGNISGGQNLDCITAGNFEEDLLGGVFNNGATVDDAEVQIPSIIERRNEAGLLGTLFSGLLSAITMGLIALAVAANFPDYLHRVSRTVGSKPVASGVVGLLTAIAAPSLIALVALISTPLLLLCGVGLVGYVVAFGLVCLIVAAGVFGWVSLGDQLADRFGETLGLKERPFAQRVAIGTMGLTILYALITALLPGNSIWTILFVSIGLGAVALTKFGRESYPAISQMRSTEVPFDV